MEKLLISEAFCLYRTDYITMRNLSAKTEEGYEGACKLLVRYFTDIDFTALTFADVRNWRNWLFTWQKPDTVRNNIICLRMVLKFCAIRGYTVLNYNEIPVAKREKRTITYLTQEEVEDFIQEVGRKIRGYSRENRMRNVAIVTLLYATGLRNSELCSLNRDSIKNRSFTMIGKSRSERIGFIDEHTEQILNEYLSLRKDHNKALFITHQTGKRMTPGNLRNVFTAVCERSAFEGIHPHTIRHSYATKLLEKRVDLLYIGDLMGHASLDTTRMYAHYANPALREIYERAHNKI